MPRKVKIAILGAGSAGLSAQSVIAAHTNDYIMVAPTLGTTCARVGCMPSKALLHVAQSYHLLKQKIPGLKKSKPGELDLTEVMQHIRVLRDHFVAGVLKSMEPWKEKHFLPGRAKILDPQTLEVEGEKFQVERMIIATGSNPWMPESWNPYRDYLLDTNSFFEQKTLPHKIAVIGLGPVGLELGQALHQLGVEMIGIEASKGIGGLTDPELEALAIQHFSKEMKLYFNKAELKGIQGNQLDLQTGDSRHQVPLALVAMGRRPNLQDLGVENLGVELNKLGVPCFDPTTLQVGKLPVFIAGDVNNKNPILHEASDEGRIAGYNALQAEPQCFERRTPLRIVFSTPNMAIIGQSYSELKEAKLDFVIGKASYKNQGRATLMGQNWGEIRLYVEKEKGLIWGAEIIAPAGEHLAHLIAWAIANRQTVATLLQMPFYHPVLEEGLRSALREGARQIKQKIPPIELMRCEDNPVF